MCKRRVMPGESRGFVAVQKARFGTEEIRRYTRSALRRYYDVQQGIGSRALLQRDQQLGAVLERDRLLPVPCQRAFGSPPDIRAAVDVAEALPGVQIIRRDGEQSQERVARDQIAIVAPQIETDLHLPVPRLGIRWSEPGGGAELLQRGKPANDGSRVMDASQQHMRRCVART